MIEDLENNPTLDIGCTEIHCLFGGTGAWSDGGNVHVGVATMLHPDLPSAKVRAYG